MDGLFLETQQVVADLRKNLVSSVRKLEEKGAGSSRYFTPRIAFSSAPGLNLN